MRSRVSQGRIVLLVLSAVCVLAVLLPPLGTLVDRYAWAEAVQYAVLATAAPALFILGTPWQLLAGTGPDGSTLADRISRSRSRGPAGLAPWGYLVLFMVAAIVWRTPPVVDALARNPVLALAELVTLFPAGCCLWLELVAAPPWLPRISRPQRAVFSALTMWTIWALAYIMAFSNAGWFSVYTHRGGLTISPAADQQVAAGIMWAIPALCFVPVIFSSVLHWLGDSSDPDEELRTMSAASQDQDQDGVAAPAPPRGWRTRSARRPVG
jgi:cytochrome c oxidase assembly factor CtaG